MNRVITSLHLPSVQSLYPVRFVSPLSYYFTRELLMASWKFCFSIVVPLILEKKLNDELNEEILLSLYLFGMFPRFVKLYYGLKGLY